MNDLIIKKLEKDKYKEAMDLAFKVFLECEAIHYDQNGIEEFKRSIYDSEYQNTLSVYGAYIQKNIIGVIASRNNGSHLALFFVLPSYQNMGVGKALFNKIVEDSTSKTITVNSSLFAKDIYQRLGFTPTAEEQNVNGIRFIPMLYFIHQ